MKRNKILLASLVFTFIFFSSNAKAESIIMIVSAEQWAIPRHGERIINMSEIKTIIQAWQKNPKQLIEISYPGGESGELWLTELKDWFIALGISSANIKAVAGSGSKDIIKLTVVTAEGILE